MTIRLVEGTNKLRLIRASHAPWLFLLGLAIVVFLAGKYHPSRVTAADLNNLLLDNNVIPGDPISLFGSIEWALAGTRFDHQWNVNSPYDDSSLSIFLIDSGDPRLEAHRHIRIFRDNAVFLKRLNAIVVDYQFIETLGNRYFALVLDMGARSILLNWIMGHEIGHLMNGHQTSHFAMNDMLQPARRDSANQYREDEADAYFADVIRATSQDVVDTYSSVFVRIVEYEADLVVGQDSTGNQRHSHPTYLVRAFRFLERLVDGTKDQALADLLEGWGRELGLQ